MEFVKFLGEGSFGHVDLYAHEDSSLYAVKSSYDKTLDKELQIMTQLKGCSRILQLSDSDSDNTDNLFDSEGNRFFMMVMEYAAGGSLSSLIKPSTKLSDSMIKDFTRMILQGLVSIHSLGYVHCDLKPDNLLLFPRYQNQNQNQSDSYDLKIADFGMSTKAGQMSDFWDFETPFVGTPVYMSPESVQGCKVQTTLDLWSLGCIVLQMYTGKYPWYGLSKHQVEANLMYDEAPPIPEFVPCDARQFIAKCFSRRPEERGSASELLLHPFLIGDQKIDQKRKQRMRIDLEMNDIITNKLKSLIPPNPKQFKRVSNKPPRMKIPCVPVQ